MPPGKARGVFVADERREGAIFAAVVGGLGFGLDLLPDRSRLRVAIDTRQEAERVGGRRVGDARGEQPIYRDEGAAVGIVRLAQHFTHRVEVERRPGCVAEADFAEEFGVVGEGGEVERPVEAHLARLLFRVVRDRDALAPREAIGVARAAARRSGCGRGGRRSRGCAGG